MKRHTLGVGAGEFRKGGKSCCFLCNDASDPSGRGVLDSGLQRRGELGISHSLCLREKIKAYE